MVWKFIKSLFRSEGPPPKPNIIAFVEPTSQLLAYPKRSPILRYPSEEGLEYEDIWFPALDGITLDGWFIPCKGSEKLIIANHPLSYNRSGYPGHVEGFKEMGGVEVNFIKDYRALHDAGYNIVCYDLRNHGRSAAGSGDVSSTGQLESRDVIGSIIYARSRPDTKDMTIGLLSRCLGANATIIAASKYPQHFDEIKALVALQPVTARAFVETGARNAGLNVVEIVKAVDENVFHKTGFHIDELGPLEQAKDVKVPTLVAQVHKDALTHPGDVQGIYDRIGAESKELFWIEGTTRRFDGYKYFGEQPEKMLGWFNKFMV